MIDTIFKFKFINNAWIFKIIIELPEAFVFEIVTTFA
jgi:hypothetical protein